MGFRRLLSWLPGRRKARAAEFEEELQSNLELAMEDAGSEREARRDFGSLTRAREEARAVWFPGWDVLAQDVRFAARTLARSPLFAAVAVLSLALGTGAATALFSLVDTVVLKPLAYRDPGQLVYVREVLPKMAHIYPTLPVNQKHFTFWAEQSRGFERLAAMLGGNVTMRSSGGDPEAVGLMETTASLFDVMGVRAQRGRLFTAEEEQPNHQIVAVITDALWRRRFGGSESILGQKIQTGGATPVVVGVLPPSFRFFKKGELGPLSQMGDRTDIFVPMRVNDFGWEGDYDYIVFGRVAREMTMAQATAELNLLEKRIVEAHKLDAGLHVSLSPLQEVVSSPVRTSLAVLLAAVLMLVLIVCVNLANLLLARGSARAREFSLRLALGASRGRLVWSALIETLALGARAGEVRALVLSQGLRPVLLGLACGLAAAVAAGGLLRSLLFGVSSTDGLTLGAVAAAACLAPAWSASRIEPSRVLRED